MRKGPVFIPILVRVIVLPTPIPHCAPAWWASGVKHPPKGSTSKRCVRCWSCGWMHRWRDRLNWNGTHSECPMCHFGVAVEVDDGR